MPGFGGIKFDPDVIVNIAAIIRNSSSNAMNELVQEISSLYRIPLQVLAIKCR